MGLKSSGSRSSIRNVSTGAISGYTLTNQGVTFGIPDSGMSRWTFDDADTSGGTAIDSWGSNDGTINGATTGATGANQTYNTNEAYSFDGSGNYVALNSAFSKFNSYSVAFWVYANSFNSGDKETYFQLAANNDVTILDPNNGSIRFNQREQNNGNFAPIDSASFAGGAWYHVILQWDGSTLEAFLDAQSQGTASISTMNSRGTIDNVGSLDGSQRFTDGRIDDVRVYNRALTSQEITNLYNNGDIRVS